MARVDKQHPRDVAGEAGLETAGHDAAERRRVTPADPGPVHDADRRLRRRGPLDANPLEHGAAQGRHYDYGRRSLAHGQQVDTAAADVG
jgi:hypothetical protein